jgi:hypothetical protein
MTQVPRGRRASASSAIAFVLRELGRQQIANGKPMNPQLCHDPVVSTPAGLNEQRQYGGGPGGWVGIIRYA